MGLGLERIVRRREGYIGTVLGTLYLLPISLGNGDGSDGVFWAGHWVLLLYTVWKASVL